VAAVPRAALAWSISTTLLLAMAALTGDLERAQPLLGSVAMLTGVLALWFATGPLPASVGLALSTRHPRRLDQSQEVTS
jgi:hypothetical protein